MGGRNKKRKARLAAAAALETPSSQAPLPGNGRNGTSLRFFAQNSYTGFFHGIIGDTIFNYLTVRSLVLTMMPSSRHFQSVIHDYLQRLATRPLLRFFKTQYNVASFCSMLIRTNALLAGSTALSMLIGDNFGLDSDLDLYARRGKSEDILKWLNGMGAVEVDTKKQPQKAKKRVELDSTYKDGWEYRRFELEGRFIDLFIVSEPLSLILDYHSTCVVNYFDGMTLTSLYPRLTLSRQNRQLTANGNPPFGWEVKMLMIAAKWKKRGFPIPADNAIKLPQLEDLSGMNKYTLELFEVQLKKARR